MIAWLVALLAIFAQPHDTPPAFDAVVLRCDDHVLQAPIFVGCESLAPDGERYYAGLIWVMGRPSLETGP